ncbi:MAG: hypothetical protein KIT22_00930 [Verrucomicrobiae bacterium]|nr:hypothetical protein [Verrucomicrobiae bacterium]
MSSANRVLKVASLLACHGIATAIWMAWQAAAAPQASSAPMTASYVRDEHSYAQPDRVITRHLALELAMDFDRRVLSGTATLDLAWTDSSATELVLDSRDLAIQKVEASSDGAEWTAVPFELAPADAILGSRLSIQVPRPAPKIRIGYSTSPAASGLQWLTPAMTLGKRSPFLFSQSQPILRSRSWVPLQDTPRSGFNYDARVFLSTDEGPR